MKITYLGLSNIKSFDFSELTLSPNINIFIGQNNSGKSTILRSIQVIQHKGVLNSDHITLGKEDGIVNISFSGKTAQYTGDATIEYHLKNQQYYLLSKGGRQSFNTIPAQEPYNKIYPYLSKRKVGDFKETINSNNVNSINGNFSHLYSKIDRLINPEFLPAHGKYIDACRETLGFVVSTAGSSNGKKAVQVIYNTENIPLDEMGEGVPNILGLIADLCMAENKIFLIEELENDIHPKALKSLLELIVSNSKNNQFFISTHSNIVLKNLGAVPGAKVFNITKTRPDPKKPRLLYSNIEIVPNEGHARKSILEELGYDLFDFDLWSGWLFLEESSAERIIRDFIIPWFVPELNNKIRTFSANSITKIKNKFDDFNKLFVFLHLEQTYFNKVWVCIDAGEEEEMIIQEMKEKYCKNSGWNESNFQQFSEHDFEKYYPERFEEEINRVLLIKDKRKKREQKRELLVNVVDWLSSEPDQARIELERSAYEVIEYIKSISFEMKP